MDHNFKNIAELTTAFPTESSCFTHLELLRWNGAVISPFDSNSKVYVCSQNQFKCSNTGKYFNAKTHTLFYNSNISLQKWFIAIWLITKNKKNISSIQLSKELNITQKSAWLMLKKIKLYFDIEIQAAPAKKMKISQKKIDVIKNIEVVVANDKLQMSEWLQLLKK